MCILLQVVFGFLEPAFDSIQLLGKPVGGSLRRDPSCIQALLDEVGRQGVDDTRRQGGIVRFKPHVDQPAAGHRINGQTALKAFKDALLQFAVATRWSAADRECRSRSVSNVPFPRPPIGHLEFSNLVQVKLFHHAPRQTFACQDVVLRFQVVIRHIFQLIKLLDGWDVRVFPLNFERGLGSIDGLLF